MKINVKINGSGLTPEEMAKAMAENRDGDAPLKEHDALAGLAWWMTRGR